MDSKILRIKEAEEYDENPFLKRLNIPITPRSNMYLKKDEAIINLSDGELKNDVILTGKRKYVDSEEFIKIFIKEMDAIFDLSKASQKVFAYMLSRVKYNDILMLKIEECQKKIGYRSKGPIFKSVAELIQKEFIAKTPNQFVYWINPKLFYKGDRLVVMREYRKTKQKEISPNQIDMFIETQGIQKKLDQSDTH